MITVIDGPVTSEMLDTAVMFGIEPTAFVWNCDGEYPPALEDDPLAEIRLVPWNAWKTSLAKEACIRTSHYAITTGAQALVLKGQNDHLLRLAELGGLLIYHEL